MATTIKSTALDFTAIKNNLKTYIAAQDQFSDYNLEASGISNILDVLAYNTHTNALIANFALNESFLSTAQLRSSVVSLAEGVGYVPKSRASAQAIVNLAINTGTLAGRPPLIQLPLGTQFSATIDDQTYTFQTVDAITATDDGNGYYQFVNADGEANIALFEGISKQKTFYVGTNAQNVTYVIPDKNIDLDTVTVKVYETATSSSFITYSNIVDAVTITSGSSLYVLKESPNEFYELTFGDGSTLGRSPTTGQKIVVEYLSSAGEAANQAQIFTAKSKVTVVGSQFTLNVITVADSAGGAEKEQTESIRKNAPFQYASQNRMVTAADYSSLVLKNFSNVIKDIQAWGGEDAAKPEFGTVFLSIVFNDDVPLATQLDIKQQVIDLGTQLSVISFDLKFDDPIETWVEAGVFFQFNQKLTTLALTTIKERVNTAVTAYFTENTGGFNQSFRRSNMLSLIDDVDGSVLSSRADIKMNQRFVPLLDNINDITLQFPVGISIPDDEFHRISSSSFIYRGQVCQIRNKLESTKLEIVSLADLSIVVDNIGSYTPATGEVFLVGFRPDDIIGGANYIKISCTPANQSAISPVRNNVLKYDVDASFISGVLVTST